VFIALVGTSIPAVAQELSLTLSVERLTYHGEDYADTDGDRAVEIAFRYQSARGWGIGAGVMVGKFDHPESDPSFTAIAVFAEPTWRWRRQRRLQPFGSGRLAWEHERVGEQHAGLWAYGWSAGPTAGLDVAVTQRVFVGAKATWVMLDMGRSLTRAMSSRATAHERSWAEPSVCAGQG
jgi:hypothetical protein